MNSETQENKDETTVPAAETISPVKENKQKGKHHGHEYKETCGCGACKKQTEKKIKDAQSNEIIIKEFINNLPNDKILYTPSDEIIDLMMSKIESLKKNFPNKNYKELLSELINTSLTKYLNAL